MDRDLKQVVWYWKKKDSAYWVSFPKISPVLSCLSGEKGIVFLVGGADEKKEMGTDLYGALTALVFFKS